MIVDFKFNALYRVSVHRKPPEVGLVEKLSGSLVGGNWVCHPYIESATTLFDRENLQLCLRRTTAPTMELFFFFSKNI